MQQAHDIIFSQTEIPLSIKRSAWLLFRHELSRTNPETSRPYTARRALKNVLLWMAGQKANLKYRQLTPKEREIVSLLVEGFTQKQIAAEMGCKLETVKIKLAQIRRKMGVITTYQVIAVAVERGWVRAPWMGE